MIDFGTVNKRFRNGFKQVKCYSGADCNSDHVLLILCMRVKLKKNSKEKQNTTIQHRVTKNE